MKLHSDTTEAPLITGCGPGWLHVGRERHTQSLILASTGLLEAWGCAGFDDLSAAHLATLAQRAAGMQVVLLGSGARQRFVPPAWLRPLVQQGISLEAMDTAAACRTYNILALEGRRVLAALLI